MLTRRALPILGLAGVVLCLLAPFAATAIRIDDPLFIWIARHLRDAPLDPFGFSVNWYGVVQPMSEITKNPPLTSYAIALVSTVSGWSDVALRLVMVLPAIAVATGTYLIARRCCDRPVLAAFAAVLTPAFMVSSLTVMSDVLMLACWIFAVYFWIRGTDEERVSLLVVAGVLVGLAALTKYFGAALVPLLVLYSLLRGRRLSWRAMVAMLIPIAMLAAYQWATMAAYGRGMLSDAAAYATSPTLVTAHHRFTVSRLFSSAAFLGGCLATVAAFAPLIFSRTSVAVGGVAIVLGAAAGSFWPGAMPLSQSVQVAFWSVTGVAVLALATREWLRRRDATTTLLWCWLIGTVLFAAVVNWTTNGRSLLPAIVPAGLFIARAVGPRPARVVVPPLVLAAALALAVAWADSALANSAREAAFAITGKLASSGRTVWFTGHWGFQYYMEARGARAVDVDQSMMAEGEWLVEPLNNTNDYQVPDEWASQEEDFSVRAAGWITTMSPTAGAGFYTDQLGLLPFAFGSIPDETYRIYHLVKR